MEAKEKESEEVIVLHVPERTPPSSLESSTEENEGKPDKPRQQQPRLHRRGSLSNLLRRSGHIGFPQPHAQQGGHHLGLPGEEGAHDDYANMHSTHFNDLVLP